MTFNRKKSLTIIIIKFDEDSRLKKKSLSMLLLSSNLIKILNWKTQNLIVLRLHLTGYRLSRGGKCKLSQSPRYSIRQRFHSVTYSLKMGVLSTWPRNFLLFISTSPLKYGLSLNHSQDLCYFSPCWMGMCKAIPSTETQGIGFLANNMRGFYRALGMALVRCFHHTLSSCFIISVESTLNQPNHIPLCFKCSSMEEIKKNRNHNLFADYNYLNLPDLP